MMLVRLIIHASHTAMQWCPRHQLAWCEAWWEGPHWIPLPWGTLWVALWWARAGGCAGEIRVEMTPCPHCQDDDAAVEA